MASTTKPTANATGTPQGSDMDAFVGFVEQVYRAWILPYWKHALVALGVILLAVIIVQTAASRRKAREAQAFLALSEAEDVDALKGVAEDFPNQVAGVQAEIQVARKLYEEGKFDQAATRFAMVAKKDLAPALNRAARLGEAYALEADGQFQAAEKRFVAVAEALDQTSAVVDAYTAAGRCAAAQNKLAEAEKWYKLAQAAAKDEPGLERIVENALAGLNTKRYAEAPPEPEAEDAEPAQDTDAKTGNEPANAEETSPAPAAEEKAAPKTE